MKEVLDRLKLMLQWSDRIGSDEINEIEELIKILEDEKQKQNSNCIRFNVK